MAKKYIDADALLKKVRQESIQAEVHGRDFSTCFLNDGNTPSTEWWWVENIIEDFPAADVEDVDRYEQGRIEGRVQMRTELLTALKRIVGDEVWRNI